MGANCCTPTKNKAIYSTHRNATYSPSLIHTEDLNSNSKIRISSESDEFSDSSSRYNELRNPKDKSAGETFLSEGKKLKVTESIKEEPSSSRNPNRDISIPSMYSNDLSSDGWSMRMFSEILASSQRGRYSFDGESILSSHKKIHHSLSSSDPDTCLLCSKLLREKIMGSLSTIAVLGCGHAFHAECLESETAVADRFDPICPSCIGGERLYSRERNKVPMSAIARLYDTRFMKEQHKASTSQPSLRRHYSLGSPYAESSILTKKKGFWGRTREVS